MKNENESMMNNENAVKSREELDKLTKAAAYTQQVLEEVLPNIKPGVSEKEIADEILRLMHNLGLIPSFDTIVASGVNGCQPHAVPSDRKFKPGDLITIDLGCTYEGYCGDLTRTFALGKVDDSLKKLYEIVKNAQFSSLNAVIDGIICRNVDAVARKIITDAGYGDYFVHGTGHGVGKAVHEYPRVNQSSDVLLQKDMVITIEPGIYLPNQCGIRIEDTVIVGGGNLYSFTKELISL